MTLVHHFAHFVILCLILKYVPDVASFGGSGDEILFYPSSNHRELCRGQIAMTPLHSNTGESARLLVGHVDDICAIQVQVTCILVYQRAYW